MSPPLGFFSFTSTVSLNSWSMAAPIAVTYTNGFFSSSSGRIMEVSSLSSNSKRLATETQLRMASFSHMAL